MLVESFQITGAFSTLCELTGKTAGSNMQIWRACFERPLDILEEQRKRKMENSLDSSLVGITFLLNLVKLYCNPPTSNLQSPDVDCYNYKLQITNQVKSIQY